MKEIFKDIPGYEGVYQVSNLGNVKSLKYGKIRILKYGVNKGGYLYVSLCKNNILKKYRLHRLVVLAFILNPENKPQVNHINGIKDDNRLENLEWCTRSENERHKYDILGYISTFRYNNPSKGKFGKDNKSSKKVNQYTKGGKFVKTWYSISDIERELKISNQNISKCCKGKLNAALKIYLEICYLRSVL